jgi:agmatine/peptidylarginine deiminase
MTALPFWPAEWAPQNGILLAWPHADTDWRDNLDDVESTYVALLAAITRQQDAVVMVPDDSLEARVRTLGIDTGIDFARVRFVHLDYDDTWLRDSGPITLIDGDRHTLLDFRFTGWGGKFDARRDDRIIAGLVERDVFAQGVAHRPVDFALEGGAVETDGQGTLLSTWHCLATRHPGKSRADVEHLLRDTLRVDRFLWLEHGALDGDDTDAHIDTLARFAAPDRIVYQGCDDPNDPHYPSLSAMADELARLRTRDGAPYHLHALPWTQPIYAGGGRRLAASYANFLIVNGAVLMPGYGDPADEPAAAELAKAFPDRHVVIVPCRPLIEQNGSLHCITMQLPQGVLADV